MGVADLPDIIQKSSRKTNISRWINKMKNKDYMGAA